MIKTTSDYIHISKEHLQGMCSPLDDLYSEGFRPWQIR